MAANIHGENMWVADSGASTHMGNVDDGMTDVEEISEPINVSNGNDVRATKKGTLHLTAHQLDGTTMDLKMEGYKYAPGFSVCLFSLTKAIENGWSLSNRGQVITLQKGKNIIKFDRIHKTTDGLLCTLECFPNVRTAAEHAHSNTDSGSGGENKQNDPNSASIRFGSAGKSWDINRFHRIFGHASKDAMETTAKAYGWKLTGTLEACEACQMSNIQQKKVPKTTDTQSKTPGERMFIDMSSVSGHSTLGGAKVWLCCVDDATGCVWNRLLKTKGEAPSKIMTLLRRLHDRKTPTKFLRMDDASELRKLAKDCEEAKEDYLRKVKFEFTARDTPQRNGKVERKIAVMTRRIKATLNAAKLTKELRAVLWGECIMYLEDVENVLQSRAYEEPPYKAFFKEELEGVKELRQFGEIAYVKFGNKTKGKLENRGIPMLYLGRPRNHSADTYRFLNLATNRVVHSRDAMWLNKVYGEWKNLNKPVLPDMVTLVPVGKVEELIKASEVADKESGVKKAPTPEAPTPEAPSKGTTEEPTVDKAQPEKNRAKPQVQPRTISTRATKITTDPITAGPAVLSELQRIGTSMLNPEAESMADLIRQNSTEEPEVQEMERANYAANPFSLVDRCGLEFAHSASTDPSKFKDIYDNPRTYDEAWNHEDEFQRNRWREAITKELTKMEEKGVWRKINRSEMEEGRRCVKHKWVFEIKRSGRFRARLVACGYSQIPGVDFTEVYSPVVNDITFRVAMTLMIYYGLDSLIFDVETAFLHGDLKELIYMDCPEGMKHDDHECVLLEKSIYGLVQASNRYNKKFREVLEGLGFQPCPSDPCLFMR